MHEAKTTCTKCGAHILQATANRTGGLCMPCKNDELSELDRAKMVKVHAPTLGLDVCRNENERLFLEAIDVRAEKGAWAPCLSPLWDDRIMLIVCPLDLDPAYNCVLRTLRIDFFGQRLICGDDETGQFATELNPARPDVVATEGNPTELAEFAANWLEREMKRVILRNEWVRSEFTYRLWTLADTGRCLFCSDSENKHRSNLGPPDQSTKVWPPLKYMSLWQSLDKLYY